MDLKMGLKLELCVEIDPSQFVILVGPQFVTTVLKELGVYDCCKPPVSSFSGIVEQGINLLLESEQFQNDSERCKYEMLYRNAYELDPMFALRKVAAGLKKSGLYADWLKRTFELRLEAEDVKMLHTSPSLQRLLELQRKGALLVYTHCDDVLDRAANVQSIPLENVEGVERWSKGEAPGILRVHGVYWEPGSVKLDCEFYESAVHPLQSSVNMVQKILDAKHKIAIGFDAPSTDPLQSKFLETFVSKSYKQHTFFMSECPSQESFYLSIPSNLAVNTAITTVTENSLSLWKQIDFPVIEGDDNLMLGLLVVGKACATEISKMLFHAPGVNFALVSSVRYATYHLHTVSIRVVTNNLQELWAWILGKSTSLLSKGLLGIVMQSGNFIWLRGKPFATNKFLTSNTECKKVLSSSNGSTMTPNQEVPMETSPPPESEGSMKVVLTQNGGAMKVYSPGRTSPEQSPSPKGKKIPRYTVHKFSLKWNGNNSISSILKQKQSIGNNSTMLSGSVIPKSVLARRCSLPPMKPATIPEGESSPMLNQLAENMQTSASDTPPSYAAIKQALLCDRYKRRQSMQIDPTTLKHLLQSKLASTEESSKTQDLVSQRRNSDPGSYLKQQDFARRRELFVEENQNWSKSYGHTIQQRIKRWQAERQERYQRKLLRQQAELSPNSQKGIFHFQLLNSLTSTSNPSHSGASPTLATATAAATASQSGFYHPNFLTGGMNPFIFPQTVFPPSAAVSASLPSMLYSYSPLITPYTFVNPYSSLQLATSAQPTTYYVPQDPTTSSQQKLFYFVPSAVNGTTSSSSGISSAPSVATATSSTTLPSLSSLIAPTPIHPSSSSASPSSSSFSSSSSSMSMQTEPYQPTVISPNNRKRHLSLPEMLNTPLKPVSEDDADLSPSSKKQRSTSDTMVYYNPYKTATVECNHGNGQSEQRPLTTLESHLLQQQQQEVHQNGSLRHHRHRHHHRHRRHSPQQQNGYHEQNGISEEDESKDQEVEVIVGGAPDTTSPKQQKELAVPVTRTQLQLWQFLLELLLVSPNAHLIQWTDDEYEFQINKPTEVAQLWGKCTNNPSMNYEKLARGLRYYYQKGIMNKVSGRKLTFTYAGSVRDYVKMRRSQIPASHKELVAME